MAVIVWGSGDSPGYRWRRQLENVRELEQLLAVKAKRAAKNAARREARRLARTSLADRRQ